MKSRNQLRTLIVTSTFALVLMLLAQFSAFAEGGSIEPPWVPYPTDTLDVVPPDTTGTSSLPGDTTDPSLLDVIITVIDVII